MAKWGIAYYKIKNSPYMPKVEVANQLYMPISNEFVKGTFIKLTWRF